MRLSLSSLSSLTPVCRAVVKTAVFASLFSFVVGILAMFMMNSKDMGFVTALLAAVGIVVAFVLIMGIAVFGLCAVFVIAKDKYDNWYCRCGFRKDLQKLAKKGLINPAHAKIDPAKCKKPTAKKVTAKKTTNTKKKSSK